MILNEILHFSELTPILISLVLTISILVGFFANNYLMGDSKKSNFFFNLTICSLSIFLVVLANNLWLFFLAWVSSNIFLTRMMIHKKHWEAAYESGKLALRNFSFGFLTLFAAIALASNFSLNAGFDDLVVYFSNNPSFEILGFSVPVSYLVFALILITAMIQSAQLPFSAWLLSSLNSPTPVSAFMHAGLVNGGAILLTKFAPVYFSESIFFNIIFFIGSISALYGISAMTLQAKIKTKLAISTVGQMGYMFMEIGMGLIPVAITHMIMHGFFKAFLFLNSGSSVASMKIARNNDIRNPFFNFIAAFICALIATNVFSHFSSFSFFDNDTRAIQCIFVMLAFCQLLYSFFKTNSVILFKAVIAVFAFVFAVVYGSAVAYFEEVTHPLGLTSFQEINSMHLIFSAIFVIVWLVNNFYNAGFKYSKYIPEELKLFVYTKLAVFSDPDIKTITASRGDYKY